MTVTPKRSVRPMVLAIVSVVLLCAGCSRPGASPAVSEAIPTAAAGPSAPAMPSVEPSADTPPSEPPVTEPAMAQPPGASITVEGGDPVDGQLGSFTWHNGGSDGPWLPGSPIHIGSGERLRLAFAQPVRLADWTVSRAPAGASGSGVVGMAEGSGEPVTFDPPPAGSWSVNVNVWFADNLGSAAYYWLIDVD